MLISILYVSGLGDRYDGFRQVGLRFWRLWGVHAQLVPMRWHDGASYSAKWTLLKDAVISAKARGHRVVVVGESAGGVMAVRAGAELPIDAIATISGVTSPNTPINPSIFAKSPAFKDAVRKLPEALDILRDDNFPSIRFVGWLDTVVPPHKNPLPNAPTIRLPSLGHIGTNVAGLTILSGLVVYHIRRAIR